MSDTNYTKKIQTNKKIAHTVPNVSDVKKFRQQMQKIALEKIAQYTRTHIGA